MCPRMGGYTPADHKTRHQDGGRDEISIADLAGESVNLAAHKLVLDAHTRELQELLRTGEYYTSQQEDYDKGSTAFNKDILYAIPFSVPRAISIDRIAIQVTAAEAGKTCRLGIYNNGTNLYPGTLLLDAGTVSVAANAVVAVTISPAQALTKGLYWLVMLSDWTDATCGIKYTRAIGTLLGLAATLFSDHNSGWYVAQAYGALPDPFTAGGLVIPNTIPLIAVRIASLD